MWRFKSINSLKRLVHIYVGIVLITPITASGSNRRFSSMTHERPRGSLTEDRTPPPAAVECDPFSGSILRTCRIRRGENLHTYQKKSILHRIRIFLSLVNPRRKCVCLGTRGSFFQLGCFLCDRYLGECPWISQSAAVSNMNINLCISYFSYAWEF